MAENNAGKSSEKSTVRARRRAAMDADVVSAVDEYRKDLQERGSS